MSFYRRFIDVLHPRFKMRMLAALLACCVAPLSVVAQAATLAECEKVKLKQLKAQHSAQDKGRKKASGSNRGPSKSRQNIDKLEEWLWKNCGNYSHEMRNLEQGQM